MLAVKVEVGYTTNMIEFNARGYSWSWLYNKKEKLNKQKIVGVEYAEGTPVPIPNTEVKLGGAENTWVVTPREDREMPTRWEQMFTSALLFFYTAQEKVKLKMEN